MKPACRGSIRRVGAPAKKPGNNHVLWGTSDIVPVAGRRLAQYATADRGVNRFRQSSRPARGRARSRRGAQSHFRWIRLDHAPQIEFRHVGTIVISKGRANKIAAPSEIPCMPGPIGLPSNCTLVPWTTTGRTTDLPRIRGQTWAAVGRRPVAGPGLLDAAFVHDDDRSATSSASS